MAPQASLSIATSGAISGPGFFTDGPVMLSAPTGLPRAVEDRHATQ